MSRTLQRTLRLPGELGRELHLAGVGKPPRPWCSSMEETTRGGGEKKKREREKKKKNERCRVEEGKWCVSEEEQVRERREREK